MKTKIKSLRDLNSFIESLNSLNKSIVKNKSFSCLTEKKRKHMRKNINLASMNAIKYITDAWICSANILQEHKDSLTPSTILHIVNYMDELENYVKNIEDANNYLTNWFKYGE